MSTVVGSPDQPISLIVAPSNRDGDQIFARLTFVEKAAARKILNVLDEHFPASPERDEVRRAILDNLAWGRNEMSKWLDLAQDSTTADATASHLPTY